MLKEVNYQVIKRHGGNFKCILISERSQPEKTMHCVFLVYNILGKDKTMETVKGSLVASS